MFSSISNVLQYLGTITNNNVTFQALLTADFEIGHYIRERVVSRAVLLYTGEGLDDDDDDDYEEEVSIPRLHTS